MYRHYEDPYKLEKMLEEAEESLQRRKEEGDDDDAIVDAYLWVEELKDRINFAWQDDEYDEMYSEGYWEDLNWEGEWIDE